MNTTHQTEPQVTDSYIFTAIKKKIATFPEECILNLGIGDTSLPLNKSVADAIDNAVREMEKAPRGYGPEGGYPFLKEAIAESEGLLPEEIFITDGIAPSLGHILNTLSPKSIAIPDLAYPQYLHAAKLAGINDVVTLPCPEGESFTPQTPDRKVDLIILNSPMNPTGTALSFDALAKWVNYAKSNGALILFDAAYRSFILSEGIPRSIYEIDGAREVAIELSSFSKSAGFSGLRLGYTVIPKSNPLWERYDNYISTMTNGLPYPIQRGGQMAIKMRESIAKESSIYMANAALIRASLPGSYGGENCPYVWWKIPNGMASFPFFEQLLDELQIALIPGAAFGPAGDPYVRLSGFATSEIIIEALERLSRRFI